MAGRELEAVQRAIDRYFAGATLTAAADAEGISLATIHRGLKRRGLSSRGHVSGPAHPQYIDGRSKSRGAAG